MGSRRRQSIRREFLRIPFPRSHPSYPRKRQPPSQSVATLVWARLSWRRQSTPQSVATLAWEPRISSNLSALGERRQSRQCWTGSPRFLVRQVSTRSSRSRRARAIQRRPLGRHAGEASAVQKASSTFGLTVAARITGAGRPGTRPLATHRRIGWTSGRRLSGHRRPTSLPRWQAAAPGQLCRLVAQHPLPSCRRWRQRVKMSSVGRGAVRHDSM